MKKDQVKVGQVYSAKVSGSMAPVRIDRANPRGGWDATNMKTRKAVRIKSAQRLRGKAATWPGKPEAPAKAAGPAKDAARANVGRPGAKRRKAGGGVAETVAAVQKGDLTKGVTVPTGKKKRQPKAEKKAKRLSGLDAAAKVLAEAGEPLDTKTMVERMLAKALWTTAGKTPAATIYAAIIREIAAKGNQARFRKTDRGRFELAG